MPSHNLTYISFKIFCSNNIIRKTNFILKNLKTPLRIDENTGIKWPFSDMKHLKKKGKATEEKTNTYNVHEHTFNVDRRHNPCRIGQ